MDGWLAIAETYIRIDDEDIPTPQMLEQSAVQLEHYAHAAALDHFDSGVTIEVLVEPGSIVQRCKVLAGPTMLALTILSTDYSMVAKNVDTLYGAARTFSQDII